MKKGFRQNIEEATVSNEHFRKVLYTGKHCQLVLMALKPREEIGFEVHEDNDQFFRFESGQGKVVVSETEYAVSDGDAVIVPAGERHNVVNVSDTEALKLYTVYAPPHHKDGIMRDTKEQAAADEPHFEGVTTES